jgi:hypothetical protein
VVPALLRPWKCRKKLEETEENNSKIGQRKKKKEQIK